MVSQNLYYEVNYVKIRVRIGSAKVAGNYVPIYALISVQKPATVSDSLLAKESPRASALFLSLFLGH
jgi:hypothetical protein